MVHTTTKLSARSRITSSSYSFQPSTDSSIQAWPIGRRGDGLADGLGQLLRLRRPRCAAAAQRKGCAHQQRVAGLAAATASASASECAGPPAGMGRPASSMVSRKSSRSSAAWMASSDAPISLTP